MASATHLFPIRHDAIPSLLQKYGIVPTTQRIEIAATLLCERQHLSADQVLKRLTEHGVSVSKATVYNTLGLFAERSLVRQVIVDPAKVFYDSNTEPHHHVYNVDDGTLIDIDTANMCLEQIPYPPRGTFVETVDIVIRIRNTV
ncbi:MAG TPA: transcriptional repressor [Gammaproteobacteria bacterium]|nr:transcriptional repressor [Gammaproteobacteria bacterium]|tara:strand:- start:737 stop:1168 length:432 start_codon:yes stop_codon:yes gene_type:complete